MQRRRGNDGWQKQLNVVEGREDDMSAANLIQESSLHARVILKWWEWKDDVEEICGLVKFERSRSVACPGPDPACKLVPLIIVIIRLSRRDFSQAF